MDPITLIMLAVLALLIFFMFRNSKKRSKDAANLQSQVVVGAKVMTNFGVYGTILSIDEEDNEVLLESTPGTVLAVHRQVVARVVTPVAVDESPAEPLEDASGEPEFGVRTDEPVESADVDTERKKSND
ncbi:preprotein translocase subunit YajC [Glaciibacter flavus]|uniref:Preprotein translocase subunit YajC n=1 Tax=Orlajensenia flava TaxID=2565934 RepID=A0A4V3WUC9_9MICO|nr:preprotein translocase subunit YajC [Glaciibacter flavus]THG35327.1 preprotein translocase subunit YajC [Glaciibacter flavus]